MYLVSVVICLVSFVFFPTPNALPIFHLVCDVSVLVLFLDQNLLLKSSLAREGVSRTLPRVVTILQISESVSSPLGSTDSSLLPH